MNLEIETVFEDEDLLVVNKPAGLPVHETLDPTRPHLHGVLEKKLNQKLAIFHRLDRDTTGLILFGKNPDVFRAVTEMFRDREMEKIYWAVVQGVWPPQWNQVKTFIKKVPGGRWANVPKGRGGDYAETHFKVLDSRPEKTLLEARLITGRTHQIRLHCLEMGHPILGDGVYGKKGVAPQALHARRLEFHHPRTKELLKLEAAVPSFWNETYLKNFSISAC